MNEELQKALGELLNKANNGIDTAGEFLAAELPEVIQQLLMWHGVYNFVVFCVGVILISSSIPLFVKAAKGRLTEGHWAYAKSAYDEMSFLGLCAFMFSVCGFAIGAAIINFQWLKIWIAPKVWLLEYAAKLAG